MIASALSACSAGDKVYEMSPEEAYSKLSSTDFERGILPGSSSHKPLVKKDYDGNPEWIVYTGEDLEHAGGWWCPMSFEPAGKDGKHVKVVNKCDGMLGAKWNAQLDELVDATLTGRPPKFD